MLDYIFPQNLFFAIVMGGTSSAVVIPLIEKISEKRINTKVSKEKIEDESPEKQDIMKSMNNETLFQKSLRLNPRAYRQKSNKQNIDS